MGSRRKGKRRDTEPVWVAHLPGHPEGVALSAGDVPGPISRSPHAEEPAKVYVLADEGDNILYVGSTRHPHQRMAQHAADKPWWSEVATTLWEDQPTWRQALIRESELIHRLCPRYNVSLNPS